MCDYNEEAAAELNLFNAAFCAHVLSGAVSDYEDDDNHEIDCYDPSEDEGEMDCDGESTPCSQNSTAAETSETQFARVISGTEEDIDEDNEDIRSCMSDDGNTEEFAATSFGKLQDEQLRLDARNVLLKACFDGCIDGINDKAEEKDEAAKEDAEAEQEEQEEGEDEEMELDKIRLMAQDTLLQAFRDGRLVSSMRAVKEESLKEQARRTLEMACSDGRLARALENVRKHKEEELDFEALRAKARESLTQGILEKQKLKALENEREQLELEALRTKARESLPQTLLKIQKEKALENMRKQARDVLVKAAESERQASAVKETEQIRLQARKTLLHGVKDGSLAAALKHTLAKSQALDDEEENDSLRQKALDLLFQASKDGRLSSALQQVREKRILEKQEQTQQEARSCLLQACRNGRLATVFENTQEESAKTLEEWRLEARGRLLEACSNGRLSELLEQVKADKADDFDSKKENFRLLAQRSFVEACKDGRLKSALKEVKAETQQREAQAALVNAGESQARSEGEELEDVRMQAKRTMVNACMSGRLTAALNSASVKTSQEDDTESLRLMAKDAMLKAAKDGRLAAALRSLEQKAQPQLDEKRDEDLSVEKMVSHLEAAVGISAEPATETPASPVATRSKRLIIGGITRAPSKTDLQAAGPSFISNGGGAAAAGRASNAVRAARISKVSSPNNLQVDFKSLKNLPMDFQSLTSYKPSIAAAASSSGGGQKVSAAMLDLGSSAGSQKIVRPVTPSNTLMKSASSGTIPLKVTKAAPIGLRSIGASIAGLDSSKTMVSPALSMHGSAAWGSRMGRKSVSMASLASPVF